tara:strand:+ start:431 stop:619 length:189 start_codon:yes stop_codon:yes gene_type:complete
MVFNLTSKVGKKKMIIFQYPDTLIGSSYLPVGWWSRLHRMGATSNIEWLTPLVIHSAELYML